jgi:hypothetical protein
MDHPDSPRPRQRRRIELQQEQEAEAAALTEGSNHNVTTIHHLNDDLLGLCHSLLGNGHIRYGPLACKMFLKASEVNPGYRKITTGESVTSSISYVKMYFEDAGTGDKDLAFFWYSAARYGRVEVMQWAHQAGYTAIWNQENEYDGYIEFDIYAKAAEYGQLETTKWVQLEQVYLYGCC